MGEKEEPHIFRFLALLQKTNTFICWTKTWGFFFNSYLFAFFNFLLKDSWFTMLCFKCTARWFSFIYIYYFFTLSSMIGYFVQFPVLYSRSLLFIILYIIVCMKAWVLKSLHSWKLESRISDQIDLWIDLGGGGKTCYCCLSYSLFGRR